MTRGNRVEHRDACAMSMIMAALHNSSASLLLHWCSLYKCLQVSALRQAVHARGGRSTSTSSQTAFNMPWLSCIPHDSQQTGVKPRHSRNRWCSSCRRCRRHASRSLTSRRLNRAAEGVTTQASRRAGSQCCSMDTMESVFVVVWLSFKLHALVMQVLCTTSRPQTLGCAPLCLHPDAVAPESSHTA